MKKIIFIFNIIVLVIFIKQDTATAKAKFARSSYVGGKHTSSHGGTYIGGQGSSHKGGHYIGPYGHHY